ncbi:MAG: polyphenol oxidase family protein, partial [Bdellovibrionales bacterium]|nr:polyphenol oxidase family protein [Bdellovibrionales bacterium]
AHWTDQTYIAPLIATADCVPVLISHNDFICTVHAGWRGVANGILCKSLLALKIKHPEFQSLRVVLGPHIQHSSFEVNSSLAINFQEQFYKLGGQDQVWTKHPTDPGKGFVNLAKILRQQLASLDIPEKSIFEFSVDTKTDPRFSSFRREKEKSDRNLSFVSRLSS